MATVKRKPNTTPPHRFKGGYVASAGGGWLQLPPKVLALVGQAPEGFDAIDVKPDEGVRRKVVDRFLRIWFISKGQIIPDIMKLDAYWQARMCGWDPRHPLYAVKHPNACYGKSGKLIDRGRGVYIRCYPEDGEVWCWWRALHWKTRGMIVRASRKMGIVTTSYKRRRNDAPSGIDADPTLQSAN